MKPSLIVSLHEEPPFSFGQAVWIAHASSHSQKEIKCPVCDGKRSVTVILGNGELVPTECEFCRHGYLGATGTATVYGPYSKITSGKVTGMVYEREAWRIEVDGLRVEHVFATEAEAEAKRVELHAEAEAHAEAALERRFETDKRKGSWSVGYHRKQIKDLERQLAWHRERLSEKKA